MLDFQNQTLLVISPHPDDELLGCGGLIKKIKENKGKVYILFLTVGITMDYSETGISTGQERLKEIEKVAKYLNYDGYRVAFFGDDFHLKIEQLPKRTLINEIENGPDISLNATKPTIVAAPYLADYNQDHHACTEAVFAATRPAPDNIKPLQRTVLCYESVPTADWWNTTEHNPNIYVTLSDKELADKIRALRLYKSQIRTGFHPRSPQSMKNLAYYRGIHAGVKAAEAFYCYRHVL